MDTLSTSASTRRGTPGLDIFKIAGRSISGFLPSLKTGNERQMRQPFTTQLEERLAIYLEYHPHVRTYQRGDASETFAQARHLHTPLGTPYRISYLYDGNSHEYLPDFVGTLCDGGLLIGEAGRESEKRKGQALAKAEAAGRLTQLKGGAYWIGTDQNLSLRRHYKLLYLHARRRSFSTYENIAATLLVAWPWGEECCAKEMVERFGSRWPDGIAGRSAGCRIALCRARRRRADWRGKFWMGRTHFAPRSSSTPDGWAMGSCHHHLWFQHMASHRAAHVGLRGLGRHHLRSFAQQHVTTLHPG